MKCTDESTPEQRKNALINANLDHLLHLNPCVCPEGEIYVNGDCVSCDVKNCAHCS